MMNYELFKEVVAEKFKEFMPEEYKDYKVDVHSVTKVNKTMDAINLLSTGDDRLSTSPTIYINNLYDHYKECEDGNYADSMDCCFSALNNLYVVISVQYG
jgi:hypothetical protein